MENWLMALSRRKFTKEVKVGAKQRLDAGASVAEVARAFEVSPNLLHRWRKEFRHGPGNAFPGDGNRRRFGKQELATPVQQH
jgi:transposase